MSFRCIKEHFSREYHMVLWENELPRQETSFPGVCPAKHFGCTYWWKICGILYLVKKNIDGLKSLMMLTLNP